MLYVMCVGEPETTAGETAATVASFEGAAGRGRHRPASSTDIVDGTVNTASHHDSTRVATQPPGSFISLRSMVSRVTQSGRCAPACIWALGSAET